MSVEMGLWMGNACSIVPHVLQVREPAFVLSDCLVNCSVTQWIGAVKNLIRRFRPVGWPVFSDLLNTAVYPTRRDNRVVRPRGKRLAGILIDPLASGSDAVG